MSSTSKMLCIEIIVLWKVETVMIKQQQAKRGSSKSEAQDKELKILTLR